jgi:phosphomannomutase
MLADQIPDYPYLQKSIRLGEDPAGVMMRLKEALARQEPDTTDGLKITTESCSVLIRPSNTEPLLRLYIETTGQDMGDLEKRYDQIIRAAMKS